MLPQSRSRKQVRQEASEGFERVTEEAWGGEGEGRERSRK